MNIELNAIANEVLTDEATKNALPIKLVQSMLNCLRDCCNTGVIASRKSMVIKIGDDASAELPPDFNGITRIGMCKNGCFYPISYNSDMCEQPCSCEHPATENTCTNCGGYGLVGMYFGNFGWWGANGWNGGYQSFFAGITARSYLGEYKVVVNGIASKWLQFSSKLAGETITFEYESTLDVGQTFIPIIYKQMLMDCSKWKYFEGMGKYNEAQYFEAQFNKSYAIMRNAQVLESLTLDSLQRVNKDLFSPVKY